MAQAKNKLCPSYAYRYVTFEFLQEKKVAFLCTSPGDVSSVKLGPHFCQCSPTAIMLMLSENVFLPFTLIVDEQWRPGREVLLFLCALHNTCKALCTAVCSSFFAEFIRQSAAKPFSSCKYSALDTVLCKKQERKLQFDGTYLCDQSDVQSSHTWQTGNAFDTGVYLLPIVARMGKLNKLQS